MLGAKAETATIPESIKILITVMDIHEILENSNTKTGTTPESMDIREILENSNMKTATTPESEEISEISLNAFLVYRLNVHTACIQLLVDVTKALCQRERGDVMSWHSYNSFDDLTFLAIDNMQHLSNVKTIVQACVECLD